MIARRFRRLAPALLVAVVALGLSGCESRLGDAATVTFHDATGNHTIHITRADLTQELHDLLANKAFVANDLSATSFPNLNGLVSTDQKLSSVWLTTLVGQTVVDSEFDHDRVSITPADTTQATTDQNNSFSGPIFGAFSKSFQTKLVNRRARLLAVTNYYETCPTRRFVSHILFRTRAQADAAFRFLSSGGSFDSIAKVQSIDTASGKQGGALGCLSPDEFIPAFQNAADAAPIGVLTGPVKTQFGYHLILVRKWDPIGDKNYAQTLTQAASAVLTARLGAIKVWVDPRYGTWGRTTGSSGSAAFAVLPPTPPAVRGCREKPALCAAPTTTTTAPAAPTAPGG